MDKHRRQKESDLERYAGEGAGVDEVPGGGGGRAGGGEGEEGWEGGGGVSHSVFMRWDFVLESG